MSHTHNEQTLHPCVLSCVCVAHSYFSQSCLLISIISTFYMHENKANNMPCEFLITHHYAII